MVAKFNIQSVSILRQDERIARKIVPTRQVKATYRWSIRRLRNPLLRSNKHWRPGCVLSYPQMHSHKHRKRSYNIGGEMNTLKVVVRFSRFACSSIGIRAGRWYWTQILYCHHIFAGNECSSNHEKCAAYIYAIDVLEFLFHDTPGSVQINSKARTDPQGLRACVSVAYTRSVPSSQISAGS